MYCTYHNSCPAGSFPYSVKKGDTLFSIAKRFQSTAERIAEFNSLQNGDPINIGDVLCIPLPTQYFPHCRTTNYYVVRQGDTLSSVADYYGVNKKLILYSNMGIDENSLYNGMILCIPIAKPPLCLTLSNGNLTLSFPEKEDIVFKADYNRSPRRDTVIKKELTSSFGGKKRLILSNPDTAVCNFSARLFPNDIVLSESDMDTVFNMVPVGTEVFSE